MKEGPSVVPPESASRVIAPTPDVTTTTRELLSTEAAAAVSAHELDGIAAQGIVSEDAQEAPEIGDKDKIIDNIVDTHSRITIARIAKANEQLTGLTGQARVQKAEELGIAPLIELDTFITIKGGDYTNNDTGGFEMSKEKPLFVGHENQQWQIAKITAGTDDSENPTFTCDLTLPDGTLKKGVVLPRAEVITGKFIADKDQLIPLFDGVQQDIVKGYVDIQMNSTDASILKDLTKADQLVQDANQTLEENLDKSTKKTSEYVGIALIRGTADVVMKGLRGKYKEIAQKEKAAIAAHKKQHGKEPDAEQLEKIQTDIINEHRAKIVEETLSTGLTHEQARIYDSYVENFKRSNNGREPNDEEMKELQIKAVARDIFRSDISLTTNTEYLNMMREKKGAKWWAQTVAALALFLTSDELQALMPK